MCLDRQDAEANCFFRRFMSLSIWQNDVLWLNQLAYEFMTGKPLQLLKWIKKNMHSHYGIFISFLFSQHELRNPKMPSLESATQIDGHLRNIKDAIVTKKL